MPGHAPSGRLMRMQLPRLPRALATRVDAIAQRVRTASSVVSAIRSDGWANVMTGLGDTGRDKRTQGTVAAAPYLGESFLSDLHAGDGLAKRICELPANEQTREWIRFTSDAGADVNKAVHQALQVLRAQTAVREALTWSRLYGGAIILLGADDGGELWQPLREDRIRALPWLTVLDRYSIEIAARYDKLGPNFRQPQFYRAIGASAGTGFGDLIHESRVIHFDGVPTNRLRRDFNGGWCDSVFVAIIDVLRDTWGGFDGAAHLLTDFGQAVVKIKGLAQLVSSNQEDVVVRRLQMLDMVRSVVRAAVIDSEEELERKSTPVSGLPELLDRIEQLLSSVTGIPVTLLMGRSPAGENATGAADIRFFYDTIRSGQESDLRPKIERLVKLLLLAKAGPVGGREPKNWSFTFRPLWQMTDTEQVDMRLKQAQADQIYLTEGVLHDSEVRQSRFGGDEYSTTTALDPELELAARAAAAVADDPGDENGASAGGE